jgi:hypothetical protein
MRTGEQNLDSMVRIRETIMGKETVIMTSQCPPQRYTPLISSMAPTCLQTYVPAPRLEVVIHRKLNAPSVSSPGLLASLLHKLP